MPKPKTAARPSRREDRSRNRTENRQHALTDFSMPIKVKPRQKPVEPLNAAQAAYYNSIMVSQITFGIGPAGTGKTWLAAMMAAEALEAGEIEKIVLTRPAVEAGESLGFLPGELEEKYEPYIRPVADALTEKFGASKLEYLIQNGRIEARPLGLIRGATFKNCYVLLDEAQNTTPTQMKMFLTRIGENAKLIINGDLKQKDIPGVSGLHDAITRFEGKKGFSVVSFSREDVVRSGICQVIVEGYEN